MNSPFAVLLLAAVAQAASPPAPLPTFRPVPVPGSDLRLIPESQRSLRRLVVGIQPDFTIRMIPSGNAQVAKDPRLRRLRERLFGIRFELLHGRLIQSAPAHTRFFVGVPEKGPATGASGDEEGLFRQYLRTRVGWSDELIERRVRFFRTAELLTFPRDMAEPLGRDANDRLVLAIGSDHDPQYSGPLERLVKAFPEDFRRIELQGVNTEGGDLSLVPLPGGGIGLLVGYHRILRFLETRDGELPSGSRIKPAQIETVRSAFRRAFFDREVMILGEAELRGSSPASEELFHADMVVSVMLGRRGPVAFVPSYREGPVDAIAQTSLSDDLRNRAQGVYDRAARQLEARGYRVVRIPFRDHPDRTPVQASAFVDPVTGQQTVLLGKYPFHLDVPGGERNRQRDLQDALHEMDFALEAWRAAPSEAAWRSLFESLDFVSKSMDAAVTAPNPHFDLEAAAYESEGIRVIQVPIFPTGEGGIHCLLLN